MGRVRKFKEWLCKDILTDYVEVIEELNDEIIEKNKVIITASSQVKQLRSKSALLRIELNLLKRISEVGS